LPRTARAPPRNEATGHPVRARPAIRLAIPQTEVAELAEPCEQGTRELGGLVELVGDRHDFRVDEPRDAAPKLFLLRRERDHDDFMPARRAVVATASTLRSMPVPVINTPWRHRA